MRKSLTLLTAALLFCWALPSLTADDKGDKTKDKTPVVAEIKIEGRLPINRRGSVKMPTIVKNAEELAKAVPNEDAAKAVKEAVDFDKQVLLVFAWAGSGQDKLGFKAPGEKEKKIVFEYSAGLTRDLRPHLHLFAIKKGTEWEVMNKPRRRR